ncbi:MAG: dihydroneopterin aldolase [Burkholderiales bacterium]|nr:dihydroneopterin aldolase [Burkholderiales bacterium]
METPDYFLFSEHYRKIFIKNYVGHSVIGVYPHERIASQKVRVHLEAWVKDEPTNDELAKTVDYDKLLEAISQALKEGAYLQEKLAENIANKSLMISGVHAVRVKTEKMEIQPHGVSVGVEIFRTHDTVKSI